MIQPSHPPLRSRSGVTGARSLGRFALVSALVGLVGMGGVFPSVSATAATSSTAGSGGSYGSLKAPATGGALSVVLATPKGKVSAAESVVVRWLFDRPVASLTGVDEQLDPTPYVQIVPPVAGKFRWASTRTLLFEPTKRLPLATSFTATLKGIPALDGSVLAAPVVTTFETERPRCALYNGVPGVPTEAGALVRVSCSQPVSGATLAAHTTFEYRPVKVSVPRYTPTDAELAAMRAKNPAGTKAFEDRLGAMASRQVVPSSATFVADELCNTNDPQSGRCSVFSLAAVPPRDARLWAIFGDGIVSSEGPLAMRPRTVSGPATFRTPMVVTRGCRVGCQPDSPQEIQILEGVLTGVDLARHVTVKNVATGKTVAYAPSPDAGTDIPASEPLSLGWAGIEPNTAYEITIDASTPTADGATLGYDSIRLVSFGPRSSYAEIPGGQIVVEPRVAATRARVRNVTSLEVISQKVAGSELVSLVRSFAGVAGASKFVLPKTSTKVALTKPADKDAIQSIPLGAPGAKAAKERGVYVVAVRPAAIVPGSRYNAQGAPYQGLGSSTDRGIGGSMGWQPMVVQRTDLGVTLKASRTNVLVAVTSLTTGLPVKNASVSLYANGKAAYWTGKTDADGVVMADPHPDRGCGSCDLVAVVEAKTGGVADVAYAQSGWREWGDDYSYEFDPSTASAIEKADRKAQLALQAKLTPGSSIVSSVFTDRGVYRLGEAVHVKGVLRMQELKAVRALPKSITTVPFTVEDPRGTRLTARSVKVSGNGSFDAVFTIPAGGSQGSYLVSAPGGSASFLVTSFRRPDFVVDMKAADTAIRGDSLTGKATANYLFGAPVSDGSVRWNVGVFSTSVTPPVKQKGLDPNEFSWNFACFYIADKPCAPDNPSELTNASLPETLTPQGEVTGTGSLPVATARHTALEVEFEAEVSDVSRQAFAARASTVVWPGEFVLGVRRPGPFVRAGKTLTAEVIAADQAGKLKAGVAVDATLLRWDWVSVNRVADGSSSTEGAWRSTEIAKAKATTSATGVVPVTFTPDKPGTYEVRVAANDARGNYLESGLTDYVVGPGEVAWEQSSDSPSVELVSDKDSYAPGETAEVLVKSPWTKATGLLTLERNGVVSAQRFEVTGSATVIKVPITSEFTPNVYATVVLTKGRTEEPNAKTGDRGRPGVLSGTLNLLVPPSTKSLKVAVSADQKEYRPGDAGTAKVTVKGIDGKPASGEVTLWAVDEGVLRLTGYTTPDLLSTFYAERSLDVSTSDSRMRLARAASDEFSDASKGEEAPAFAPAPGGGGGEEDNGNGIRTDFRILAAWSASVKVGANGEATVPLKLPQSLTAYRLIAVAASGADRFGSADSTLRISTPFQVRPALPRFVAYGDTFEAGAVIQNLSGKPGPATVSINLPADSPIALDGPSQITVPSLGTAPMEVRFKMRATKLGTASFTLNGTFGTGDSADTKDAVSAAIPVLLTQRFDTVATNGELVANAAGATDRSEKIAVPKGAIPGLGGLKLSVSSSYLAGIQQSIDSLVEYPYGCLEQRSSRVKVLLGLVNLEGRYELPGLAAAKLRPKIQAEINKFGEYVTPDGGLSYWPGGEVSDVYLSSSVLSLLLDAKAASFKTPPAMIEQLTSYLGRQVSGLTSGERGEGESDVEPVSASVASVLARAGAPEPGLVTTLVKRFAETDDTPYTEKVALLDAMLAAGDTGAVPEKLYADLLASVRLDGSEASVEDPEDWYGTFFSYRGTGTTTATADLLSLVTKIDPKHPLIGPLSQWLLNHRVNGTWGDTYTNGSVLHAFTDVARIAEKVQPEIAASLAAGTASFSQSLGPKSLDIVSKDLPLASVGPTAVPLVVGAKGVGTLHWSARLRYALPAASLKARNQGFSVERTYFPYRSSSPTTTFKAGDLVTVELVVTTPDRRANVVIDDALPAGFEALDATLVSTATDTGEPVVEPVSADGVMSAEAAGVNHSEVRDDRVLLFATQLEPGTFRYTYTARATAPGSFVAAPAHAEEMYRANVYGRSAPITVTITPPKP